MVNRILKIRQLSFITLLMCLFVFKSSAQYKSFLISAKGDTINVVDKKAIKQGKWVINVAELRGEPGYDEEGFYKDDKKTGTWRKYNSTGDIIAVENYRFGGKDGLQEYFSFLGDIMKQEEWRAYNPDAPYDTIPVYGPGNGEIISYKIVKAAQYSVPHGEWKYYEPGGRVAKVENYERGHLLVPDDKKATIVSDVLTTTTETAKPTEKVKTKEILEYEKKYSKKKRKKLERVGKTIL